MYSQIYVYKNNIGSSGDISEQDINEILELLNGKKYIQRLDPLEESFNNRLDEIRDEIKKKYGWLYEDNCHTLVRKVNQEFGFNKIPGYLVENKDIGKTQIILRAHSVVKDNNGDLVELTGFWNINSYSFIEHKSGEHGIDLQAS